MKFIKTFEQYKKIFESDGLIPVDMNKIKKGSLLYAFMDVLPADVFNKLFNPCPSGPSTKQAVIDPKTQSYGSSLVIVTENLTINKDTPRQPQPPINIPFTSTFKNNYFIIDANDKAYADTIAKIYEALRASKVKTAAISINSVADKTPTSFQYPADIKEITKDNIDTLTDPAKFNIGKDYASIVGQTSVEKNADLAKARGEAIYAKITKDLATQPDLKDVVLTKDLKSSIGDTRSVSISLSVSTPPSPESYTKIEQTQSKSFRFLPQIFPELIPSNLTNQATQTITIPVSDLGTFETELIAKMKTLGYSDKLTLSTKDVNVYNKAIAEIRTYISTYVSTNSMTFGPITGGKFGYYILMTKKV